MKKLLLLFAALLVAGCGEKSSSEGSKSVREKPAASSESAEPSSDTAKRAPAEPPVAESPSEESGDAPKSLSDADVEQLLKEAVDHDSLEERDAIFYQNNTPYSGWVKKMYDSGKVAQLAELKKGKVNSLVRAWHENGQKQSETIWENAQKISVKYWNSKGEEVESREESEK